MAPKVGTSRADFPGGTTEELWDSIQAILALPEDTRLFVGHDYGTDSRNESQLEATVAEHRAENRHVKDGAKREDWIKLSNQRDATRPLPDRNLAALQINLRGGRLPESGSDGHSYLNIPVNRFWRVAVIPRACQVPRRARAMPAAARHWRSRPCRSASA